MATTTDEEPCVAVPQRLLPPEARDRRRRGAVFFSEDGMTVAVVVDVGGDWKAMIGPTTPGSPFRETERIRGNYLIVQGEFSPDGQMALFTTSAPHFPAPGACFFVVDSSTGRTVFQKTYAEWSAHARFMAAGAYVVATVGTCQYVLWRVGQPSAEYVIAKDGDEYLRVVDASPVEPLIVFVGEDEMIRVKNIETGDIVLRFRAASKYSNSAVFSSAGGAIAFFCGGAHVRIWNRTSPKTFLLKDTGFFSHAGCFSPDGRLFFCLLNIGEIGVWDIKTKKLCGKLAYEARPCHFMIAPDGESLLARYLPDANKFSMGLLDGNTGERLFSGNSAVGFSRGGPLIVSDDAICRVVPRRDLWDRIHAREFGYSPTAVAPGHICDVEEDEGGEEGERAGKRPRLLTE